MAEMALSSGSCPGLQEHGHPGSTLRRWPRLRDCLTRVLPGASGGRRVGRPWPFVSGGTDSACSPG